MAYDSVGICEGIEEVLEENPRTALVHLSKRLNICRHTLGRAIQGGMGTGFRDFQRRILLERSLVLLVTMPHASIKEIAYLVGYNSPRAFGRFIKVQTGLTPMQVRRGRPGVAQFKSRSL